VESTGRGAAAVGRRCRGIDLKARKLRNSPTTWFFDLSANGEKMLLRMAAAPAAAAVDGAGRGGRSAFVIVPATAP